MTHTTDSLAVILLIGATVGWSGACRSSSTNLRERDDSNQGGGSAGEAPGGNGGISGSATGGASTGGAATGGSSGAAGGSTGGSDGATGGSSDTGGSGATGGSSGATGGTANGGSATGGSSSGGSSGAGGSDPSACGDDTCAANQLCIRPCCGGTAPQCTPLPDSGVCPPETDPVPFCPGSSGAGCEDRPCTPRAPFCMDVPAECGSPPSCSCLGNVCDPGACGVIESSTVHCMCA